MSDAIAEGDGGGPTGAAAPEISADEVRHVARLARLDIAEDEVDRYATELSAILLKVDMVRRLDTSGVDPVAHPYEIETVLRRDEVRPSLDRDDVLAEAPAVEAGRFKVPRILGTDQ